MQWGLQMWSKWYGIDTNSMRLIHARTTMRLLRLYSVMFPWEGKGGEEDEQENHTQFLHRVNWARLSVTCLGRFISTKTDFPYWQWSSMADSRQTPKPMHSWVRLGQCLVSKCLVPECTHSIWIPSPTISVGGVSSSKSPPPQPLFTYATLHQTVDTLTDWCNAMWHTYHRRKRNVLSASVTSNWAGIISTQTSS